MNRMGAAKDQLDAIAQTFDDAVRGVEKAGLQTPRQVRFGSGVIRELSHAVQSVTGGLPDRVLVVGGWAVREPARRAELTARWGREIHAVHVHGEPNCKTIHQSVAIARQFAPQIVIGIGGGSAIDTAKALAAMIPQKGSIEEYLEGADPRRALDPAPLPVIAVPTTAGTGAEMTRNAVIGWTARRRKRSLRDDRLMPTAAIIDPDLTIDLPPAPTLWSGLDALTQLMEVCISQRATPTTTTVALRVIGWIRWALPRALADPHDAAARAAMAAAASLSGVCLANAGLAMAHGIAAALGAIRPIPHGLACGILLPHTLRYNRDAAAPAMSRVMAAWLGEATVDAGIVERGLADLDAWYRRLGVPADLRAWGLTAAEVDEVAAGSLGRSMEGNPILMTVASVRAFLDRLI